MIAAVTEAFKERADDPVAAIGRLLLTGATAVTCATPASSSSAEFDAGEADVASDWKLLDWLKISGMDVAVASALRRHAGHGNDALQFLRGLSDVSNMRKSRTIELGEAVVDALAQLGRTAQLQVCE